MGQKVNPVGMRIGIYVIEFALVRDKHDYATSSTRPQNPGLPGQEPQDALCRTRNRTGETDKGTNVTVIVYVGRPASSSDKRGPRQQIKKD
jgi:hypothetical protein